MPINPEKSMTTLKQLFPACFRGNKPLKKTIRADMMAAIRDRFGTAADAIDEATVSAGLGYHCRSIPYLKRMLEGAARLDMYGNPTGQRVTKQEAFAATELLAEIHRQRKARGRKPTQSVGFNSATNRPANGSKTDTPATVSIKRRPLRADRIDNPVTGSEAGVAWGR